MRENSIFKKKDSKNVNRMYRKLEHSWRMSVQILKTADLNFPSAVRQHLHLQEQNYKLETEKCPSHPVG